MRQSLKPISIALIILLFFSTGKAQNNQQMKEQNIVLSYSDGSGNTWKINVDSIIYMPMTPELSSSGIYNGGIEVRKSFDETRFAEILSEFEKIFKNTSIHIPKRIMTSGMLMIHEKNKESRKAIIAAGNEKEYIESLLKKISSE